jgi:hypothetical protein
MIAVMDGMHDYRQACVHAMAQAAVQLHAAACDAWGTLLMHACVHAWYTDSQHFCFFAASRASPHNIPNPSAPPEQTGMMVHRPTSITN